MPGFVTAQPPRKENRRSHAQALLQRRAWRGPDRSGRALRAAPKAGLNRRDLARHHNGRSAGERFPPMAGAGVPVRIVAVDDCDMIPPELRAVLGPLADLAATGGAGPRVRADSAGVRRGGRLSRTPRAGCCCSLPGFSRPWASFPFPSPSAASPSSRRLEVKTWSGAITGSEGAPVWTRSLRRGRPVKSAPPELSACPCRREIC